MAARMRIIKEMNRILRGTCSIEELGLKRGPDGLWEPLWSGNVLRDLLKYGGIK